MTPLVSVIMPVQDGARWLAAAITSIQQQSLPDFELLIVDDGSVDESAEIAGAYSKVDPRIQVILQSRLGLVVALNRGLIDARAPLIARLDADDRAYPHRLARQSEYLAQNEDIGLLGAWADKIDAEGRITGTLQPASTPHELARLLLRTNPFVHSSIMLRKQVLQNAGLYRPAFQGAEDYDLWLRLSELTQIAILPERLLQYRVHTGSVSSTARLRQLFSTRLAQRAAQDRQRGAYDPTIHLTAPPDWSLPDALQSPVYGDLARLYHLLSAADSIASRAVDLSPLDDPRLVLTHAERKMAQVALLTLIKRGTLYTNRTALFRQFIRLHPPRALAFLFRALVFGGTR